MEKFGIFELLDTLSALTEQKTSDASAEPGENKTPRGDGAFDPPSYPQPPQKGRAESDALQGFLARHDAVARKADGKKS